MISLDALLSRPSKETKNQPSTYGVTQILKNDNKKDDKKESYHGNRRASLAPPPQAPLDYQHKEVLVRTPRRGKNTRSIVVSNK